MQDSNCWKEKYTFLLISLFCLPFLFLFHSTLVCLSLTDWSFLANKQDLSPLFHISFTKTIICKTKTLYHIPKSCLRINHWYMCIKLSGIRFSHLGLILLLAFSLWDPWRRKSMNIFLLMLGFPCSTSPLRSSWDSSTIKSAKEAWNTECSTHLACQKSRLYFNHSC